MSPRPSPSRSTLRRRRLFALFMCVAVLSLLGTWWWRLAGADRAGASAARVRRTAPYVVAPDEAAAAVRRFAAVGAPVFCGGGRKRAVALTFDDGPGPYTAETVRVLREAGARATFFFAGRRLSEGWVRWKDVLEVGEIGNHGWNHIAVTGGDPEVLAAEIDATTRALEARTGAPVHLFRPPYGERDGASSERVRSLGMVEVLWTIDSGDSAPDALARAEMATLEREIRPGAIVLLHENRGPTHTNLAAILELLERRRLQPVTVSELLALDPPSPRQLRTGECP